MWENDIMWNEPSDADLRRMPTVGTTGSARWSRRLIREHFFLGRSDWYLAEYDPATRVFFGFAILNGDHANAEWGYVSLDELRAVSMGRIEVDRDLHWRVRPAAEVAAICAAYAGGAGGGGGKPVGSGAAGATPPA